MHVRLASNDSPNPPPPKPGASRLLVFAGCLLLLAILGWLDDVTGYEMSFFVFYSVPVGVAAWWLGRWPAIALALVATATWLLADYLSGAKYSAPFYYYWNSTIHFLAFMINAVTIAKIKSDLDRRQSLAVELDSARAALRAITAVLPACPGCGKPRDVTDNDGWPGVAPVARQHRELAAALCDECKRDGNDAPADAGQPEGSTGRPEAGDEAG